MAKVKCPQLNKEVEAPDDCPKDCVYLFNGECVNPLANSSGQASGGCV